MIFQMRRSQYIKLAAASLLSIALGLTAARMVANEPNGYVAGYTWFAFLMLYGFLVLCLLITSLILLLVKKIKFGLLLILCSALLAGSYLIGFAVMQKLGWTNFHEEMIPLDPDVADLIILFKPEASHDEIENFWQETLSMRQEKGSWPRLGIRDIGRIPSIHGHEAVMVNFFPSATESEREDIKSRVKSSPIVYKVFENVPKDKREKLE
jgi:hypothetical protein